ncbi:hypothetical protein ES704_03585 [subsurface metagenome]
MSNKNAYKIKLRELIHKVILSNNKLLLLTGTLNYFIDSKDLPKKKNNLRLNLVKSLEKQLNECGIFGDEKKDEELRERKHDFVVTTLDLTHDQISLLIEGLDHFMFRETRFNKKYLEIKNYLEETLKEDSP